MGKTRNTGYLGNIVTYDASNNIVLPALLTIGTAPDSSDNSGKVPSTAWVRNYVTNLGYQSVLTLTTTGSSGAATFSSNILNIPNYTLSGLGGVSGSGTTNYVSKWTGSTALGNSQIFDNGTSVGINTATPNSSFKLDVNGDALINGVKIGRGEGGISTNTAIGNDAIRVNLTGFNNTAIGYFTLYSNTTGNFNTALGSNSLKASTTGSNNVALGSNALLFNTTGWNNTAIGLNALYTNVSSNINTAVGANSLYYNTAAGNTGIGVDALIQTTTGANNTALGYQAGGYATGTNVNNSTSSNSVYLGYRTRASASGNTNEIVIGYETDGNGSNSITLGNTSITNTYLRGAINLNTVNNATTDTDRFLVSEGGIIKYRTGTQILSDIGAEPAVTAGTSSQYYRGDKTFQTLNTTAVAEGTNLYYTDARVGSYLTTNSYATQTYVNTQVSNLVNSAPATLDTLNELATALGNDPNFATTIATSIGTKQAQLNGTGFVKVTGTTVSYDNSTYLTTSSASSTYLPLSGGTLTGGLSGTTASFSSFITAQSTGGSGLRIYGSAGTNQWDMYLNSTNLRFSDNTGTGKVVFDTTIQTPLAYVVSSSVSVLLNRTGGTTFGAGIQYQTSGTNNWIVGTAQATVGTDYSIYNYNVAAGAMNISYATNNVQVGSTTDAGFKFDVNGTGRFSGTLETTSGGTERHIRMLGYNSSYVSLRTNTGFNSSYNAFNVIVNSNSNDTGQGNTSIPSWEMVLGGNLPNTDSFYIGRSPAGSFTMSTLFKLSSIGAATFSNTLTAVTNLRVNSTGSTGSAYSAVLINSPVVTWNIVNDDNGGGGDLRFYNDSLAADAMRIKRSNNNVGINTANPLQALAVNGNVNVGNLSTTLNFTGGGNARFLEIGASGADALLVTHASGFGVGYFGYSSSDDRLVIACDNGSGGNKIDFIINAGSTTGGGTNNLSGVAPSVRINNSGYLLHGTTDAATTNGNVGNIFKIGSNNNNLIIGETSTTNRYLILESRRTGRTGGARNAQISLGGEASDNGEIQFHTAASGSGISERLVITPTGVVRPGANGTQDLGTSALRWGTIFTSDLSLSNGIGDYTIVEGENDLFLYNNKNNKVYKFLIEEVDPSTATPKKSN